MHVRRIAPPASISPAVAVLAMILVCSGGPLRAQQPDAPPSPSGMASPAQVQEKLDKLQAALKAAQAAGDGKAEADRLNEIGVVYYALGDRKKALEFFNQALPIYNAAGDRGGEAQTLSNIGSVYSALGEKQKALDVYSQALPILRAAGDRGSEARTLNNIGMVFDDLGEKQKALEFYNQALPIRRTVGDRRGEAITLSNIGLVYSALGEKQKALEFFNQALPISRTAGDRNGEASTLSNIGSVYSAVGDKQKALEFFDQALPINRAVGDRGGEATTLSNIGLVYDALGEKQKALEFYNQALPIERALGNRGGEAITLTNIGAVYDALGEQQKALECYSEALPIYQAVSDRDGEAITLNNIGGVYEDLGEGEKALEFYNQALPIKRAVGDRGGEATTLSNIGLAYSDLGEKRKALEFYSQALPIRRAVGDRAGEAYTLINIGGAYEALGERQKALEFYNQALPIATAVGDPVLKANIFDLMRYNQRAQRPSLAIFYGKQAVNLLQQVRGNIQGLDQELQKSFLSAKDNYYRGLADLLIAQARLPEAQQVLDLLKQQEYSDYTRGEAENTLSPLSLTPAERQAEEDYQRSTAQTVAIGQEWADLRKISARTPDQEARYKVVSDQIEAANEGLSNYYKRLYVLLGADSNANKQIADVKGDVSELSQALAKMPHTVALYTLVGKDSYRTIVITGSTQVAREYPIAAEELNKKVAAFEQVLRNRASDPKPAAQELYNILIGPVKADLDLAHAETLVWSLDGALRYVPIAALYDGKQYVVERYRTVTITPVSIPHIGEKPDVSNLSAAAMGISNKYEAQLPELTAVVGELDDIVKDRQVEGANGVLPGTILLNNRFTEKAMEDQLGGQHGVVHIASHFVFNPGDDKQSYLLLAEKGETGKGFHLTVADFNDNPNLTLNDTELLTLSACETGMSGTASNGREVDGLGTMAQRKGAKAVISTLWSVDDASTGELMADFYGRWAGGGGKVEKVEALRQAQLDLLLGKGKSVATAGGASGRGMDVEPESGSVQPRPVGFAHPYYWAPFVLMGNWR